MNALGMLHSILASSRRPWISGVGIPQAKLSFADVKSALFLRWLAFDDLFGGVVWGFCFVPHQWTWKESVGVQLGG